jgi:hypothetical protein
MKMLPHSSPETGREQVQEVSSCLLEMHVAHSKNIMEESSFSAILKRHCIFDRIA